MLFQTPAGPEPRAWSYSLQVTRAAELYTLISLGSIPSLSVSITDLDTTERETEAQAGYGVPLGITQSGLELTLESRALLLVLEIPGALATVNPAGLG